MTVEAAITVAAGMLVVWVISVAMRDASIVDLFWGFGFVLIAWVTFLTDPDPGRRITLVTLLVTIWGLRLTGYLAWRNLGHGEDYRYRAMRRRWGSRFWLVSLGTVFALQGVLMYVVSLPVQASRTDGAFGLVDLVGVAMWLVGFGFETVGDAQLARFKADPDNVGKVMDTGLWRYTRHPNYFGDFCVWWGLWLIAASGGAWWTAIGPIVMTVLLVRVSGAALLERTISRRRPEYEDYIRRTNAFFPGKPR